MSDLLPLTPDQEAQNNNLAMAQAGPQFQMPLPENVAQARQEYSALPLEDTRPPDYEAMAAQNAAVQQAPGALAPAGSEPIYEPPPTYSAFQASVLGIPDSSAVSKLDSLANQVGTADRQQQGKEAQDLEAMGQGFQQQAASIKALGDIEAAKAEEAAPIKAQLAAKAEAYEQEVNRINDQARFETDRQMQRVKSAAAAAQSFEFKDFWATRNTAGTIMGIIAQALGGGLNALNGQPGAPTALDRVIQQDWAMQQAQAANLNQDLDNQNSVLRSIRATTEDNRAAAASFYSAATTKITTQINAIAERYGTPTAKANAQAAIATLQTSMAEKMQRFDQQSYQNRVSSLTTQADILGKRQGLVNQMAAVHFGQEKAADAVDKNASPEGATAGGVDISGLSLPPKQKADVIKRLNALEAVMHDVEEYENNPSKIPSVNTARIAAIKNLIPTASGLTGSGLSEYVQKLEASRIPGAYEVVLGRLHPGNAEKFRIIKEDLRHFADQIMSPYNLKPIPGSYWDKQAPSGGAVKLQPESARLTPDEMRRMAAQSRGAR